ncbi:MAG: GmrSD restriction endonuclease domain-containing protein, partial [Anaerolineae bacterium]
NELATPSPRSPSLFAYYAALNLLGAKVLFSDVKVADLLDPSVHARKSALERHHLFPKGYLQRLGYTAQRDLNQIANFALVEWGDNLRISDEPPAKYFPRYARRVPAQQLQQMRYWHGLPEAWEDMDYPAFLEARRKLMARVVHDGYLELTR